MSRFKKSQYRTEKAVHEKPFEQQQERCEGQMGMCGSKKVMPCGRCQKPFCGPCSDYHVSVCRGMR